MLASVPLPLSGNNAEFTDAESYVQSLLSFATSEELFQKLCGGVHILDFLTKEPDLYGSILPKEWQVWLETQDLYDVLDILARTSSLYAKVENDDCIEVLSRVEPPESFVDYIQTIRKHSLARTFPSPNRHPSPSVVGKLGTLPLHVAVGMKRKKIHEVQHFAGYVDSLITNVNGTGFHNITHVIDFGSGQNYLGRVLASPPYCKDVIALESKEINITGAKGMDVTAKLAEKKEIMRNKKLHRMALPDNIDGPYQRPANIAPSSESGSTRPIKLINQPPIVVKQEINERGSVQYVQTMISDGDLSQVIKQMKGRSYTDDNHPKPKPGLMVVSLHSCGNLSHHGLKSLVLNDSVKAVAIVGCCYNLVTERLGPPTYKLPSLRSPNLRLETAASACDPHGFPMSERLATYQHSRGQGVRMNITARMMGVQAPDNWTTVECESFFIRHFYRALLQRILLDHGVVGVPTDSASGSGSPSGWTGPGPALTIGSLRKSCYVSFQAYVRGALAKLASDPGRGPDMSRRMAGLTDENIQSYEEKYKDRKKDLSILWSLMAFSATVVESLMVVDRWLYLKEQDVVKDCWVETVFDYKQSPRNLVVVGIKN